MAKVIVIAILAFLLSLSLPQTRPTVLEYAEPALYPIFVWQTKSDMERIGGELTNYENQYYKLPTSGKDFPNWLAQRFKDDKHRVDSWGTGYRLKIRPEKLAVISSGPDRTPDTEDDIRHELERLAARRNQR